MSTSFFNGAFFGGEFFSTPTGSATAVVGGHGSEEYGTYEEPRRVFIDGKPYTVSSKAQYLGLLARARRDKARSERTAEESIARAQAAAREALQARQVEETRTLLHDLLAREAKRKPKLEPAEDDAIPMELLMMIATEL